MSCIFIVIFIYAVKETKPQTDLCIYIQFI